MNYTEYFWLGFLACYVLFSVISMTFVAIMRSVELLRERAKLKRELLDKEE